MLGRETKHRYNRRSRKVITVLRLGSVAEVAPRSRAEAAAGKAPKMRGHRSNLFAERQGLDAHL